MVIDQIHTEKRDGEILIANISDGFEVIGWKTIRLGRQAYCQNVSKILDGECYTLFLMSYELEKHGIETDYVIDYVAPSILEIEYNKRLTDVANVYVPRHKYQISLSDGDPLFCERQNEYK